MVDSELTGSAGSTPLSYGSRVPTASVAKDNSTVTVWADSPHSTASYEAFLRDLPELMQSHAGQCAAYQDGIRWGVGPRRQPFFQEIYAKGADPQRMLFFTIEPQVPHEVELLTPEWETE